MNKLNRFHVFSRIKKILVAGVVMAAVTVLLAAAHTNVVINVALSGSVYFAILFFFKESLIGEMKQILAFGAAKAEA